MLWGRPAADHPPDNGVQLVLTEMQRTASQRRRGLLIMKKRGAEACPVCNVWRCSVGPSQPSGGSPRLNRQDSSSRRPVGVVLTMCPVT